MAYVDLNPIRAGLADRPENSDCTSLQERLDITPKKFGESDHEDRDSLPKAKLMAFAGAVSETTRSDVLPYSFPDYLQLVDWTGRATREDRRGSIPGKLPPILQRLNTQPEQWLQAANGMERHFYHAIGPVPPNISPFFIASGKQV